MYNCFDVANTIIVRANGDSMPITGMKLQRLLYLVNERYMGKVHEPLINERFEAWKTGIALTAIYDATRKFHDKPIKGYIGAKEYARKIKLCNDDILSKAFNGVWSLYGNKSGTYLSAMVMQKDTAWYNTVKDGRRYIYDSDILLDFINHRY